MCISSTTLNSIGLICDIIGVLLLLFFWVVPQTAFIGMLATFKEELPENYQKKLKRMNILSSIGLALIIFGFVLQLISNYVC